MGERMCSACWRRLVSRLQLDLSKSIARNDALIRAERSRSIDSARSALRVSRESLVIFRGRWV